jgi:hypothetical protein
MTQPSRSSGVPVLTTRQLSRATLERQLLLERVEIPVLDAVEALIGLQGQDPKPPYYGLATRLADFDPLELSDLLENRQVVRMTAMRSTVHLMTAADALLLRPLCQPVVSSELRVFRRRLEGVDLDELAALVRSRCGAGPVPLKELGAELSGRWPDHDGTALKAAARILLPLVQAPPRGLWGRGGQVALATAQHWLGAEPQTEPDVEAVALRYLTAFGPASVQDMQLWCGLTRLAEVFERLRPRLRTYRDERGVELFDLPDAELPDPLTPAPPRFLGEYDNALIGHKDRRRILPEEIRQRDWEREYHFATFLVDGFVRGLWRIARTKGTATLHLETFAPLTGAERAALEQEAAGLLTLVAPGDAHDLVYSAAR